jgi:hypothetical protein
MYRKSVLFLYASNEILEIEIVIKLMIASKQEMLMDEVEDIKYLHTLKTTKLC